MTVNFDADRALDRLAELVRQHGPEAVNIAVQVVQINAIQGVVVAAAALVALVVTIRFATSRLSRAIKQQTAHDRAFETYIKTDGADDTLRRAWKNTPDSDPVDWIAGGAAAVIAAVSFVMATTCLLNIWTWIALFNPHLALAHDVWTRIAGAS